MKGYKTPGSGRVAGVRNKKTEEFAAEFDRLQKETNFSPIQCLFTLGNNTTDDRIKVKCCELLLKHRYATPKSIEVDIHNNIPQVSIIDMTGDTDYEGDNERIEETIQ